MEGKHPKRILVCAYYRPMGQRIIKLSLTGCALLTALSYTWQTALGPPYYAPAFELEPNNKGD